MIEPKYLLAYILIGLVYVLVNGWVRRIYTEDEDWWLVLLHWGLWWLFFILLAIVNIKRLLRWIGREWLS